MTWFTSPSMTDGETHDNVGLMPGIGVYPGSFNPPTLAHIEIALAVVAHHGLERLDLAVSTVPLGKGVVDRPPFHDRIDVIRASIADHSSIDVVVCESRLIVDIAAGYDVVVMGADKWAQIAELEWYSDEAERDAALAALPRLALIPRHPLTVPAKHRVPVGSHLLEISSTAVRAGRTEWMTTAAREFNDRTGAWHSG